MIALRWSIYIVKKYVGPVVFFSKIPAFDRLEEILYHVTSLSFRVVAFSA